MEALKTKVNKRIYLASPHMGSLEKIFVNEAFDTNWVAPLGPNVNNFEKEVAEYVGAKHASALVSGTSAIHLAIKLLGIKPGDIVFCSSLTFAATCNPIIYEGAEPVFIDAEYKSLNMCPVALRNAFEAYSKKGKLPKAVIVVHLYGQSSDMDKIMDICNEYNVPVIEDAAESLGATYKGKQTGTIGKYGIYSFNGKEILLSDSQFIDQNNFINNGFTNTTVITEGQWNIAFPDKSNLKLLMWTDDMSKTDVSLETEIIPFRPIDKLKKNSDICNILFKEV